MKLYILFDFTRNELISYSAMDMKYGQPRFHSSWPMEVKTFMICEQNWKLMVGLGKSLVEMKMKLYVAK